MSFRTENKVDTKVLMGSEEIQVESLTADNLLSEAERHGWDEVEIVLDGEAARSKPSDEELSNAKTVQVLPTSKWG